jgi:hypothetical protein
LALLALLVLGLAVAVAGLRPHRLDGQHLPSAARQEDSPLSRWLAGARSLTIRTARTRVEINLPGRCVELGGGCARIDATKLRELLQGLRTLVVDGAPAAAREEPEALRLTIDGREALVILGACPSRTGERRALLGATALCVPAEVVARLGDAASDPLAMVDRRLVAAAASEVQRVDGPTLALVKERVGWKLGPVLADPQVVDAWLDELTSLVASEVSLAQAPRVVTHRLTLSLRSTKETLLLAKGQGGLAYVQREGEPVWLAVPEATQRLLLPQPLHFGSRTVLSFDPYRLWKLEVTDARGHRELVRGETVDDWRVVPSGDMAQSAVVALRDVAAELRALRLVPLEAASDGGPWRRITFWLSRDPAGTSEERLTLEVGARGMEGTCYARRAGESTAFLLAPAQCASLELRLP